MGLPQKGRRRRPRRASASAFTGPSRLTVQDPQLFQIPTFRSLIRPLGHHVSDVLYLRYLLRVWIKALSVESGWYTNRSSSVLATMAQIDVMTCSYNLEANGHPHIAYARQDRH